MSKREDMPRSERGWQRKLAETARRNRVELIDAKLTRRELFKLGLLAGSGYLITKLGLSTRAAGASQAASPPTTPWLEELPIPPVARPLSVAALPGPAPTKQANLGGGEAARADHQSWEQFFDPANCDVYVNENRVTGAIWHRELPPDECWLFNG